MKTFRRSLLDTRVKRAADVASDYHLLTGTIKLKIKKNKTERSTQRLRYNTRLLKDTQMLEEFKITVKNKYKCTRLCKKLMNRQEWEIVGRV